jgi:hypothetical protein
MNVDRNMKLLLMKLGKKGNDVTLTKEQRYSKEFGTVYSRYKLTFWIKEMKIKKGKEKECNVPITHEFNSSIDLLKYMVVRSNE